MSTVFLKIIKKISRKYPVFLKLFSESILTKRQWHDIIIERCTENAFFGGIAQLARAFGSYPEGRGFKSNFRYQPTYSVGFIRPGGQAAKTPPFHGGNTSSILVRVTKTNVSELLCNKQGVRIRFLYEFRG